MQPQIDDSNETKLSQRQIQNVAYVAFCVGQTQDYSPSSTSACKEDFSTRQAWYFSGITQLKRPQTCVQTS